MKIYSIMYESLVQKGRVALTTALAENIESAHLKGVENIISSYGQLVWIPRLMTCGVLADVAGTAATPAPEESSILDKNWLMKTIIESKDIALLDASKKYLSRSEFSYLSERIA